MRTSKTPIALAAMALAGLTWGCSTDNFATAPQGGVYDTAARRAPYSPNNVWTVVASASLDASHEATVQGSRYTLHFSRHSLESAEKVTISERDPNIVDVQFNPDGIEFKDAVTLTVNYAGTANDPDSPTFHGFSPILRRYEPTTAAWNAMPGADDPVAKTFTVELTGFSRYAMTEGVETPPGAGNIGHTGLFQ